MQLNEKLCVVRVFILILFLIFSIQSWAKADDIFIDKLFGVKILDNINNYANKKDGVKQDHLKNIITFHDETLNIERNQDFDSYYIRTDKNYKIHNITARKIFVSEFNNFTNDCKSQKSTMVKMLSSFFNVPEKKFINYFWLDPRQKAIYDDSRIEYSENEISLILSAYCGYFSINENLVSVLFVSWITGDYQSKHVDGRWTKIESFDDKFIKNFLSKDL